jgi:hypothetical protein
MERCPICRAKSKEEPVCSRCGTDLSVLLSVETQAEALERQAVVLLGAGDLIEAQRVARQALQFKRSPLVLALSGFLTRELIAEGSRIFERLLR